MNKQLITILERLGQYPGASFDYLRQYIVTHFPSENADMYTNLIIKLTKRG